MLFVVIPREAKQELQGLLQRDPIFSRPLNEFWQRLSDFTEVDPSWLFCEGITKVPVTYDEGFLDSIGMKKSAYWLALNIRIIDGGRHIFHCWAEDNGRAKCNVSL